MTLPRVLLADDHAIVAEGLKRILLPEFDLVGLVEDGHALIEAVRELDPDVIVADISMPGLNGIEALQMLKREKPDIRMVFLTMHREVAYARRALDAGAKGFVLKHSAPAELVQAINAALIGGTFVSPSVAGELLEAMREGLGKARDPAALLSVRQREILRYLASGLSAKQIGAKVDLSARTVEAHKYRMMETLGVSSSAELVRFAIKHGIVSP